MRHLFLTLTAICLVGLSAQSAMARPQFQQVDNSLAAWCCRENPGNTDIPHRGGEYVAPGQIDPNTGVESPNGACYLPGASDPKVLQAYQECRNMINCMAEPDDSEIATALFFSRLESMHHSDIE